MTAQDLKNSILQLAVHGKLVPQDTNDEPASELFKRICIEKDRMIDIGKIKKEKPLPRIADDEKPFDIPNTWIWLRLGDFCLIYNGNSINVQEKEEKYSKKCEGYSFIATKDVGFDNSIDYENGIYIPIELDSFKKASCGSILMCMEGGSAGRKIGILDQDVCFGNKLCCFAPIVIFNKYLYYFLQSPIFFSSFLSSMTGIIGGVGASKIKNIVMPIPPFAEQERIVAKIEELLPYVEEYDKAEKRLAELNDEFPDKLRKSILQQAVQGKLTERHPDDEPASELLKRIHEEKAKLITNGKIKKEKSLPTITDDEKPFDIPDTWEWVKLGELITNTSAGKSPQCVDRQRNSDEWGVIKTTAIQNGYFLQNENKVLSKDFLIKDDYVVQNGDLLITRAGPKNRTGVMCVVDIEPHHLILSDKTVRLSYLRDYVDPYYIVHALNSPAMQVIISSYMTGMAESQVNISQSKMKEFILPLPPLAEQKRIVARVEELLAVCDKLK